MKRLLGQAVLFVNLGANCGYYCCFAQQAKVRTIALEPHPVNAQMLARNMVDNGWGKDILLMPVAAGAEPGFIELFGMGGKASVFANWHGQEKLGSYTVPVVRLDYIIRTDGTDASEEGPKVVLMDVEGYELEALAGAGELLFKR